MRATFTIAHVVSAALDTIPEADREAVACWGAGILCDELAAFYSGGTDSTIRADSSPGQTRAQEYSSRANKCRKRYFDALGIDEKKNVAAGVVVNLNQDDSRGNDRLTHSRAFR